MAIRQIKVTARNLPEGLYRYKIVELSEDTDPKKGSDMFKIKFATVSLDDGNPCTAWDQFPLSDDMIWKFAKFLESLGYVRMEGGTNEFDDTAFVGKQGYLECIEKEVEKDGKSRTFTNYETDTGNYLWNQFESLQPAPMLLGFQTEFKDHRQGRDP